MRRNAKRNRQAGERSRLHAQKKAKVTVASVFAGTRILFVWGAGKVRLNLLCDKVRSLGGVVVDSFSPEVSHIISNLNYDRTVQLLASESQEAACRAIHTPDFISESLKAGRLLRPTCFLLNDDTVPRHISEETLHTHGEEDAKRSSPVPESPDRSASLTSVEDDKAPLEGASMRSSGEKAEVEDVYKEDSPTSSLSVVQKMLLNSIDSLWDSDGNAGNASDDTVSMHSGNEMSAHLDGDVSPQRRNLRRSGSSLRIDRTGDVWDVSYARGQCSSPIQEGVDKMILTKVDSSASTCTEVMERSTSGSPPKSEEMEHHLKQQSGFDLPPDDDSLVSDSEQWLMYHNSDDGSILNTTNVLMNLLENDDEEGDDDDNGCFLSHGDSKGLQLRMAKRRANAFACQKRPEEVKYVAVPQHKTIIEYLEKLRDTETAKGEPWRKLAYTKAIAAIKRCKRPITSGDEARLIRGIGGKIADKIDEIINTGHLRKIDQMDEHDRVITEFSRVWGAGSETVKKWYTQGYRTLEDLRNAPPGALNSQQQIGLKHVEDFQTRIPREEVQLIEQKVFSVLKQIDKHLVGVTCGSYRRGRKDCGDVDILITHEKGASLDGILKKVTDMLYDKGILTDHLTRGSKGDKYMGVCLVAEKYRRIDLQMIPRDQWPCALLYFTGSAHFNRSIRLWARKNGFSLSEKALVSRLTEDKSVTGVPVPIETEKDIFDRLHLNYLTPAERDI